MSAVAATRPRTSATSPAATASISRAASADSSSTATAPLSAGARRAIARSTRSPTSGAYALRTASAAIHASRVVTSRSACSANSKSSS